MKTKIGLWIDHREAIIVTLSAGKESLEAISSNVDKQLRRSGDSPLKGPYEALQVPADDSQLNAFNKNLNVYYDSVIKRLRIAESILLFGPAEAKDELRKRLEKEHLGERVVCMETVDKMTKPQIRAKTREYFQE